MLLLLYRAGSAGLAPLAPLLAAALARRRRATLRPGDRARIGERLGRASAPRPAGRIAWIHAASVAEAEHLSSVVDQLASAGFHPLVTTRRDEPPPRRLAPVALHQCAPLDAPHLVGRFVDFWRPDIALFAGCELWPNLILETRRRGVPIALVNAAMPARRFLLWRRARRLAAALLGSIDICLARTDADAERLRSLGAAAGTAGDPLYDLAPPPADAAALARLAAQIGARPVWAALGAGEPEAELAFAAHRRAAVNFPDLVTIIASREPDRGAAIAARAAALGLEARFADAAARDPSPAVLIAAAAGPALICRLAGIVYLSGPARGGGVNPVVAARLGCAILHGRAADTCSEVYAALDAAGGCAEVADAQALANELALLLFDQAEMREMGRAAAAAIERRAGATARIMLALAPWLTPRR